MTVRAAKFVDIPRLAELLEDTHERSMYAQRATFDPIEARRLAAQCVQRHGAANCGGTLVLVSESNDEVVRGFLIGMLDQVYPCLKELMASDLFFVIQPGADPRDAPEMLRRLLRWAESNPKVIEVRLGVTDAIGDWCRTAKLYTRLGLEQCGVMFRRSFER